MTEQLFKLKKDGKTVGYLKITDKIWWKINRSWIEIDPQEGCSEFFEDDNGWDTAHPFVTKDKNGKDVFAEDKVKSWYPCGRLIADDLIAQYSRPAASNEYNSANMNDIELIEDKDND